MAWPPGAWGLWAPVIPPPGTEGDRGAVRLRARPWEPPAVSPPMSPPTPGPRPLQVAGRVCPMASHHRQAGAGPAGAAEGGRHQREEGGGGCADHRGELNPWTLSLPPPSPPRRRARGRRAGAGLPVLTGRPHPTPAGLAVNHAGGAECKPGPPQPGNPDLHAWTAPADLRLHSVLVDGRPFHPALPGTPASASGLPRAVPGTLHPPTGDPGIRALAGIQSRGL